MAVLCDFTGVNFKKSTSQRVIAPFINRLPESLKESENPLIDCTAFDIWTYSLMSLNVLTGSWPMNCVRELDAYDYTSWKANIEPILKESLKAETFDKIMRSSLPAVNMAEKDICVAHDFVQFMMKWDPSDRPIARQVQEHPFLSIEDCHKEKSITEERYGKEEKVQNLCFEGMTSPDNINENPVSLIAFTESINRSFKEHYVENTDSEGCEEEKDEYIFSNMESFKENSPLTVLDEISDSIPVSSEKHTFNFVPIKKVSSKKKKNFGRKVKAWIAKNWHSLFNMRNN